MTRRELQAWLHATRRRRAELDQRLEALGIHTTPPAKQRTSTPVEQPVVVERLVDRHGAVLVGHISRPNTGRVLSVR